MGCDPMMVECEGIKKYHESVDLLFRLTNIAVHQNIFLSMENEVRNMLNKVLNWGFEKFFCEDTNKNKVPEK